MIISERIFKIMESKNITQKELSARTGIAQSCISNWNTKKTNPAADKIMVICDALDVSVEEVLQDTMSYKQINDRDIVIETLEHVEDLEALNKALYKENKKLREGIIKAKEELEARAKMFEDMGDYNNSATTQDATDIINKYI